MKTASLLLRLLLLLSGPLAAAEPTLENEAFRIRFLDDGRFEVTPKSGGAAVRFAPEFLVLTRRADPGYTLSLEPETAYRIPTWTLDGPPAAKPRTTRDLFEAARPARLAAQGRELTGASVTWSFPAHDDFALTASLELPPGRGEPLLTFRFTARRAGWYSVGYAGAPEADPAALDSLWQPLVWQERRFPARSYLSLESMCSLPATLYTQGGVSVGVAADPAESPFRQPTHRNSRFGVVLRNPAGRAQPMLFAPVLGLPDSSLAAGARLSFRLRLVVHAGDPLATFRHLARGLYSFHDYRRNGTGSLNETLENLLAYALNDPLCGWIPEQKGSDYSTDVPGSVKNVSALHPLSLALLTDSADLYRRRALPMTEYLLSRQKYLFAPRKDIKGQSASHLMRGPAIEVSELAALHGLFQGRTPVLRHHALDLFDKPRALNLDMISEGGSWQGALALYRLTGDRAHLARAIAGADAYVARRVDRPQTDFTDVRIPHGGQFWTDFAPQWVDLLELYEETRDPRHLRAAVQGAKLFSTYAWVQPVVPAGDVRVNPGGQVGLHYVNRIPNPQPLRVPEQWVPAWRVAQVGLMPEASTTHAHNPSVFLAHHAPYFHRLGHLTQDAFLHDLARSAVVGRYASFPGYDTNGEYTTLYQRPDYPNRPWRELTYNNVFYNHVWPLIAVVADYLVTDAFVKSGGRIAFPSRYAQGYAFLQSKVYGDRPGTFYGDEGVRLWLPRSLLRTDSIQANYLAGYGNGKFYLALLNQSDRAHPVKVRLHPDVVPLRASQDYAVRVWTDHTPSAPTVLRDGEMQLTLPARGIVAAAVEGLAVTTQFQDLVFSGGSAPLGPESFAFRDTPFGRQHAMLLSLSPAFTNAFIWLEATPDEAKEATLSYRDGTRTRTVVDAIYPFEFSLPLAADQTDFEFTVSVVTPAGERREGPRTTLRR